MRTQMRSTIRPTWTGAATLLLVALVVPRAVEAEPVSSSAATPSEPTPEIVEMVVPGLSCPFCAYGLEKRLQQEIEDLSDLEIEAATGKVTFRVADGSKLSDEDLRTIVRKAGFSVEELERRPDPGHQRKIGKAVETGGLMQRTG